MFGAFLFLTYFLQNTRGYTPIQTGLAFLPLPAAIVATSMTVQNVLLKRVGPRPLMTFGLLLGAGGMAWLAQLTPTAGYGAERSRLDKQGGDPSPALPWAVVPLGTIRGGSEPAASGFDSWLGGWLVSLLIG